MNKFIGIIIFALFFISCTQDETCRDSTQTMMQLGFVRIEDNKTISLDSILVQALDTVGVAMDSLLYNFDKNISSIKLPLNKAQNTSIFILKINEFPEDTLRIFYENRDYFISYACGMTIAHTIDTILSTKHLIQDIKIIHKNIDTNKIEHAQILL